MRVFPNILKMLTCICNKSPRTTAFISSACFISTARLRAQRAHVAPAGDVKGTGRVDRTFLAMQQHAFGHIQSLHKGAAANGPACS